MAIPDVGSLFDPFLRVLSDGQEHRMSEIAQRLAETLEVSAEEQKQLLPSGKDGVFSNRLGWARTYLKKAGLVEYPSWGVFRITNLGLAALSDLGADQLNLKYLKKYPTFLEFYSPAIGKPQALVAASAASHTHEEDTHIDPEGAIEADFALFRSQVAQELLTKVKSVHPNTFEWLVVKLLLAMGYGGSQQDAGRAIGRTGDGGIDGVIQEDRLGLDLIYLQAKRWEGVVGRPVVQAFVGALHGRHAGRGVLITTSNFTNDARQYAATISDRIILIDGERLVQLMIEFNVGVRVKTKYDLKVVDPNFFEDIE